MRSHFYSVGSIALAIGIALSSTTPANAVCPEAPEPDVDFIYPDDGETAPANTLIWVQANSSPNVTVDGVAYSAESPPVFAPGTHILVVTVGEGETMLTLESEFTTTDSNAVVPSAPIASGITELENVLALGEACRAVFRSGCNDTLSDPKYYAADIVDDAFFWRVTDEDGQQRSINGICPPVVIRERALDEEVCFDVAAVNVAGEISQSVKVCDTFGDPPSPQCSSTDVATSFPLWSLSLLALFGATALRRRRAPREEG